VEDCKNILKKSEESAMNSVFMDQMTIANIWRIISLWNACKVHCGFDQKKEMLVIFGDEM